MAGAVGRRGGKNCRGVRGMCGGCSGEVVRMGEGYGGEVWWGVVVILVVGRWCWGRVCGSGVHCTIPVSLSPSPCSISD